MRPCRSFVLVVFWGGTGAARRKERGPLRKSLAERLLRRSHGGDSTSSATA